MAPSALAWAGLGWWTASTALHWATAILAGQRRPLPDRLSAVSHSPADFSIVAPMSGAADVSVAYVQALMALAGAGAEVLICVAAEDDGAAAPLRELWPDAPILVGNDTTFNPKMNNVRKGLEAARRVVLRSILDPELERLAGSGSALPLTDYKSTLQEKLQGAGRPQPLYALVQAHGPEHRKTFTVEARLRAMETQGGFEFVGRAEGSTKKNAEQDAARQVLEYLAALPVAADGAAPAKRLARVKS